MFNEAKKKQVIEMQDIGMKNKKTGLPSTKSTSRSTGQTPMNGADTEIVSCAS